MVKENVADTMKRESGGSLMPAWMLLHWMLHRQHPCQVHGTQVYAIG